MLHTDLKQVFLESANEVLETMFFTGACGETENDSSEPLVAAELGFRGDASGRFGLQCPVDTSRLIASNFLGMDHEDLSESQMTEVIGELSNMICGSVLSRLQADGSFELDHPLVHVNGVAHPAAKDAVDYTFALEEGTLRLWISEQTERN